jgi:hypothetical protein
LVAITKNPQNLYKTDGYELSIHSKLWSESKYKVQNDGPNRKSFEIENKAINGEPFRGMIGSKEAKHGIYRGCLGLKFKNFYVAHLGWNGCPAVSFI